MSNKVDIKELQEFFNTRKSEPTIVFKTLEAPVGSPFEGQEFTIKVDKTYSNISRIFEICKDKIEKDKDILAEYSDSAIEAAVWFAECIKELDGSFDIALDLANMFGMWTVIANRRIKEYHGITDKVLEDIESKLNEAPLKK